VRTIDLLMAEHDIIERGLAVLERAVRRIESGQPVPDAYCRWAPEFLAKFADACHHAKEEDLLFPLLKQRGVLEQGGPIGVMLYEHDAGRDCVRRMREACAAEPIDKANLAAASKQFITVLRQHIFKENNILFRMASNLLSEEEDVELDARFTQVEQQRELPAVRERYTAELARWEREIP